MKARKAWMIAAVLVAVLCAAAALTAASVSARRSRCFSLANSVYTAAPENIEARAAAVVTGRATGRAERFGDGSLSFRLVEFEVTEAHKGSLRVPQTLRILQTEGFGADVRLEKDAAYCLYLEPYAYTETTARVMQPAEGAYVVTGAFKGVYEHAEDGTLRAVRTAYETEEQTLAREREMQTRFDRMRDGRAAP